MKTADILSLNVCADSLVKLGLFLIYYFIANGYWELYGSFYVGYDVFLIKLFLMMIPYKTPTPPKIRQVAPPYIRKQSYGNDQERI